MAFDAHNLGCLAYTGGFTIWHYRTTDGAGVVRDPGYFKAAHGQLRVGDFIFVNAGVHNPRSGILVVLAAGSAEGEPYVQVGGMVGL